LLIKQFKEKGYSVPAILNERTMALIKSVLKPPNSEADIEKAYLLKKKYFHEQLGTFKIELEKKDKVIEELKNEKKQLILDLKEELDTLNEEKEIMIRKLKKELIDLRENYGKIKNNNEMLLEKLTRKSNDSLHLEAIKKLSTEKKRLEAELKMLKDKYEPSPKKNEKKSEEKTEQFDEPPTNFKDDVTRINPFVEK
jgi:hypothetical protein